MKLWLLDADVIIDLLGFGLFDTIVERHEIYVASTIIGEVQSYKNKGRKYRINFREKYVDSGKIKELSAEAIEISGTVLSKIPKIWQQTIHVGEIESLTILVREENLTFCTCDANAISALPFLGVSERCISVERLIQEAGLKRVNLKDRHTEDYFKKKFRRRQNTLDTRLHGLRNFIFKKTNRYYFLSLRKKCNGKNLRENSFRVRCSIMVG